MTERGLVGLTEDSTRGSKDAAGIGVARRCFGAEGKMPRAWRSGTPSDSWLRDATLLGEGPRILDMLRRQLRLDVSLGSDRNAGKHACKGEGKVKTCIVCERAP